MPVDKVKLIEKIKTLTPEDRAAFREALAEADPESFLSPEEVNTIREMLKKPKKSKSILDSLFE